MASSGFKLSLAGAKSKPGLKAPLEKPAKRRRLALDDDEPEDDTGKQEITGWDAAEGGAVDANKKEDPKGPRVIPALPNRNWRDEARKRQLARTGAAPQENSDNAEQMEQPKMAFGLTTFTKKDESEQDKPEPMDVDDSSIARPDNADENLTEEQKLQAEAFDALVNGKSTKGAVIPISEEEAFRNDIRDAPDAPTLEAYEATPIEGFGAALLRGMGWKDGESLSKDKKPLEKPKEIKRRPALLGIGAKPESAVGIELGEWGQEKRNKYQKKTAMNYNPVTLRNKHTGEMITEEELKERLEAQKQADEKAARNSRFVDENDEEERRREKRRERRDRDDEYGSERRKDKSRRDDEYDSERRRDKSRRDERRQDRDDEYSDRDRRREKKYSEYDDSDRDRRRDRKHRDDDYDERRRERRRDKDSRYRDRSRSPYDDERRDKRRERERRNRYEDERDDRRKHSRR